MDSSGTNYRFFTPQNTGTLPLCNPLSVSRHAEGGRYCPNGTNGTTSNIRACSSAAIFFCAASSALSIHAVRSSSSFASVGQPNQECAPIARNGAVRIGSTYSGAGAPYGKSDQPPLSSGSLLVRRCTTVPQSTLCSSTLKPAARSRGPITPTIAL